MYGRPPRRKGGIRRWRSVECSHVYGLLSQRSELLALMTRRAAKPTPRIGSLITSTRSKRCDPLGFTDPRLRPVRHHVSPLSHLRRRLCAEPEPISQAAAGGV